MKDFKAFKASELPKDSSIQIIGGNGEPVHNEDVPVTTLGTITHDDDI